MPAQSGLERNYYCNIRMLVVMGDQTKRHG